MVSAVAEKQDVSTSNSADEDIKLVKGTSKKGLGGNGFLRVFAYGSPGDYALESVGILAAIGSGVALALVNLVIGDFFSILSNFTNGNESPEDFMKNVSKYALTRNVRHAYLHAAFSQEISYFDHGTGGSISMQATSNGKLIQNGVGEKLGQIFGAVATFVAAFILAFISQWKLTLIIICILPTLLLVVCVAAAMDAAIETKVLKVYAQAGSFAEAVLGSIRTTQAFDLRPRMVAKYSEYLQDARVLGDKKNLLYGFMFAGEYFVIFAGMGLAFWQGIAMLARGEITGIGTIFTESSINSFDTTGKKPATVDGNIELQGISFSYPTRPDTRVLEDFSLYVPAGKVTALVGASGSGKSTVIGLLERWYDPSEGTIKLDGEDIDKLNLKWLRTNIRLVQQVSDFILNMTVKRYTVTNTYQEPVLFNGSVFKNIANGLVGTEWESAPAEQQLERVKSAAKQAFADEFIENLPEGYDTRIGERGGLLSGGQKQRIAIARSVISDPKILLLDEATSALDPHAEGIVQKALDEASKNRTTIVIAHKLKTIRHADNIVVMKKGAIVEQGHHEDLVSRGGAYAALVKAQDLSPQEAAAKGSSDASSDDGGGGDGKEVSLEPTQSLGRRQTAEVNRLDALKNREDYSLAPRTGVIHTVMRLVAATPELWSWYIIGLIVCIVGAGVFPGQALLLGNVMDIFGAADMVKRGNFISLMFLVMAFGLIVVYWVLGWATNVIAQVLSQKVRGDMFNSYLRQDLRFFDRPENTVGSLTSGIDSHAQAIFELMGFNIGIILVSMVSVVVCSILSIAYTWKLGLVGVFAGLPPMIIAGYIRIRVETNMNAEIDAKFSKSASIASETVTAIRTVSSLAIEDAVLRRYVAELDNAIHGCKPSLLFMMVWFAFTQAVEYFILALGFWWGSKLVAYGDITFYQFMVSFMTVYFAGQGFGQVFVFVSSFTKANASANYYFWLQSLEPTIQETPENKDKGPKDGCSSYSLQDVEFSYPLAPHHRIEPGQFVAFVGASGCGKSTMVSLLERFYDPNNGRIQIDGSDSLSEINPRLYRRRVALVQQEPTLFPGSIRENIAMGIDNDFSSHTPSPPLPSAQGNEKEGDPNTVVDDATIEAACRAANAWDFVSSLPEGLGTLCGTSGNQLSGGQKQRIAIARALVRSPGVILLDEATSALDTESERVVQAALMRAATTGNRITVAVAHRLSTVRSADRIFVFYGGRIVEAGTHDDLIAQGGIYKKMCESQSLDTGV
ncbi:putative multidrug resistance protein 3 (p glycoprotein 3) protein [Eutypa lata UCREL1]|uniref:Putative multidrug resistance protein 3 (P glycoprotein 3) protein n=1 Tax=Eutypa lata (strain UCR-EL1) TaxID=1287681 RepID=M7TZF2_EUTLA|nr:putative multidrug resistance protein 3 (p glycoprotein 3) protein [Eutypa lata UCREL1]